MRRYGFSSHNAFLYGDHVRDDMKNVVQKNMKASKKKWQQKKERRKEIAKGYDEGEENRIATLRIGNKSDFNFLIL